MQALGCISIPTALHSPKVLEPSERSKIILQCPGKLLVQKQICISHVLCDRFKNSIEQLNGEILESIALEEFHLVEKIHETL